MKEKRKVPTKAREVLLLDAEQVEAIRNGALKFTRRQALSMVMGTYDPLGLISPALFHGKLLLRRLYGPQLNAGWDSALPREERERWASWFQDLLTPSEATFPRSTKPKDAIGGPRLAGFGDASLSAICVVVYVVWSDRRGDNHSRVLTGKCRVAPLSGTTVPRGELQAMVVLHRLILTVVEAFPYRFQSI